MSRRPRIGVIADDLTGAAEIGGVGLRAGLCAEVLIGAEAGASTADLVCIDSDSRSCGASQAAKLAQGCAKSLKNLNPAWIYKKVDSVLRGNVLAELEAIMKELGFRRALLVPANPSFGRIVRDGVYYLKSKPLAETDFARDPEYPRLVSDVRTLLESSGSKRLVILKPGQSLPDSGVFLGEVSSLADVQHWAQRQSADTFCAGGAEFFNALIGRSERGVSDTLSELHGNASDQAATQVASRQLFVCGSICGTTQRFVTESQAKGMPVFYLRHRIAATEKAAVLGGIGQEADSMLETHRRVILSVQPPLVDDREMARQFAADLVRIAHDIVARRPAITVYIEGGATAAALVQEMGWRWLEVLKEVAPGVVTLRPWQSATTLTIKPGSYPGWES